MLGIFVTLCAGLVSTGNAQQLPDRNYHYTIEAPTFATDSGPVTRIDAAHSRFTERGLFDPFIKLLGQDGFAADYLNTKITKAALASVQILVIANPARRDFADFPVMQPPSAYQPEEIAAIRDWVIAGGRLLLIADHPPFAGGAEKLAEALGFTFFNGYVFKEDQLPQTNGTIDYTAKNGLNKDHAILENAFAKMNIEHFLIVTGSAFIPPADADPVLTIPPGYVALVTQSLRQEVETAPRVSVSGLSQGSTMVLGKGRLAVFAEAGSFTAQIINGIDKMGMNNYAASQNAPFVLATMRWLAHGL